MPKDDRDDGARQIDELFQRFKDELLALKKEQSAIYDQLMKETDMKKISELRRKLGLKD